MLSLAGITNIKRCDILTATFGSNFDQSSELILFCLWFLRQISKLIYISTVFVHPPLSRSSICFPRFSGNLPFPAQWSSNKRKNFSETQPTTFNRKLSEKYEEFSKYFSFQMYFSYKPPICRHNIVQNLIFLHVL